MSATLQPSHAQNRDKNKVMDPLLLVEDKNELRAMLRKALERAGYPVDEAPDGTAAIQKVRARRYQVVITDLKMPGASGLDVLRATKSADPTIPVLLLTAFGSVEEAVTAMKEGAFDFLQKPVDLDHLKLLVERAARQQELLRENLLLREEYSTRYGFPRIVGEHPSIRAVSQDLQRVAATDSTVLLLGESGTGKELFARAVHHLSPRRDKAFVALNCAAIPESLVENELFGHERGAFTGAAARKIGKMDLAHHGTLFLDEMGDLPLAIQAKLLRVIEERRFERVGGTQSIDVDVRIVVATNRDLRKLVEEKLFREDLYFRISAVPMTIPPLPLAWQRPRIAKHPRTRSHSCRRPDHSSRRPATSLRQTGRRAFARWLAPSGLPLGGFAGRCHRTRGCPRRTRAPRSDPSRLQMEQNPRRRSLGHFAENPAR